MAQIDDTIATYLTAIDVEGKTANTVLSYRASLGDFRRVGRRFGFPDELEAYSVEHVYRFLGDLKERGASPAYRHRRHREVKTFFSWCRRMEYVEGNVFAKVALVKLDQQIRPPFSPDEIQRLLGSLDRTNLPGCRNHAVILFLLDTGVRVSECVSIRLDDVDWERRRVLVRETKNKHDRWLCQIPDNGWGGDNGFPLSSTLGRNDLRDQRAPPCEEELPLLGQRDVGFTAAADSKVLLHLLEGRAEPRGRLEIPEAPHRVVPLLHAAMALLGVIV